MESATCCPDHHCRLFLSWHQQVALNLQPEKIEWFGFQFPDNMGTSCWKPVRCRTQNFSASPAAFPVKSDASTSLGPSLMPCSRKASSGKRSAKHRSFKRALWKVNQNACMQPTHRKPREQEDMPRARSASLVLGLAKNCTSDQSSRH